MSQKYIVILLSLSILPLTSCDLLKDGKDYLKNDQEHEGKMLKNAFSDFWSFTVETGGKSNSSSSSSSDVSIKNVWLIKDASKNKRIRAAAEADADITLPDRKLQMAMFKTARYILLDTKADVVKMRLWTKNFRHFGGVFAELVLAKDGLSWNGRKNGKDKFFRYTPASKPWKKLTADEIKALTEIQKAYDKIKNKSDKPEESSLRIVAGSLNIPPQKLYKLIKKTKKYFKHPKY